MQHFLKRKLISNWQKKFLKNIIKEIQSDVSVDFIQKTVAESFKVDLGCYEGQSKKT